ncbi:MAG: glycosyltransferase [Chitinophagales bacterium]
MKLSIVIVNYNVRYFLEQTILSVLKSVVNFEYEIFVVDNNSTDDSLKMLEQKFPAVHIIANKENVGFSKANNQAIRMADGEYILLLNPDTIIQEDTLQKCINKMESDATIGGLGVKMYDGAGNFLPESKRGFPSPLAAFAKMSGLAKVFPKSKTFGQYHLSFLNRDQSHEVNVLSGACMFLRKSVLDKVGLLDEDYFMYGEDIDLSYRIKQAGFKNYYFADTSIIHFKGESTKKGSLNYIKVFYNAMIIFANKHVTGTRGKILKLLLNIAIYIRAFLAIVQKVSTPFALPLIDAVSMTTVLYVLHLLWENVIKREEQVIFPETFFYINIPMYVTIWLLLMWFFGVYNKTTKWRRLIVGLTTGTLVIAIAYAFFPNFLRTSRGVIVSAFVINCICLSLYRLLWYFANGTLHTFISDEKKYIIISGEQEAKTIAAQLQQSNGKYKYLGFISIKNGLNATKNLGSIENLNDILDAYKPNDILFSTEELSTQFIIDTMSKIKEPVAFRLVTKNNTIISSTSKNTSGEIYSFDINLSAKENWLDKLRNWI